MNQEETNEAKSQDLAAQIIGEKVEAFESLIEFQSRYLSCSDYQIGLYNGLILGKSLLTGEEPQFYQQKGGSENEES